MGPFEGQIAVRIRIDPIAWTNDDDPELGGDTVTRSG
jgi:hypothetical protein